MKYAAVEKRSHKAVAAVLIVLAVLLAAAGILAWMVFSDPNAGRGLESVPATNALAEEIAQSAVAGKESSLSADDLNGYLAYLYRKNGIGQKGGNIKIQAAAVSGTSGDSADLYLPVLYQGRHLGVVLNVTPALDDTGGKFVFRVNSARVGRLSVPADWALDVGKSRMPAGLSVSGNVISCKNPSLSASMAGVSASLKISTFHMENGLLKVGSKIAIKVG